MTLILEKRYFFINLDVGTRADGYDSHGGKDRYGPSDIWGYVSGGLYTAETNMNV
jgi:hypothetical protein